MVAKGGERKKKMELECALLLVSVCGAAFLQLLRHKWGGGCKFSEKSDNLL